MSFWIVPLSFSGGYALLFGRNNIERHDGQHRAVHRHRHRHAIERNLIEQHLHIEDGIDGYARLADIAFHALVIGVVAAMRGEIECHRKPLLPGGQVAPIKSIGLFGSGKSRVLPDRPRLHHVHACCRDRADKAECLRRNRDARGPLNLRGCTKA